MADGSLVYGTGGHLCFGTGGHLVFKSVSLPLPASFVHDARYVKNGSDEVTGGGSLPDWPAIVSAAIARMESDTWSSYSYPNNYAYPNIYASENAPIYYRGVFCQAWLYRFNTSAYNGATLATLTANATRIWSDWGSTPYQMRLAIYTSSSGTPDDSFPFTGSPSYADVNSKGSLTYTFSSSIVLDDYLFLAAYFADYGIDDTDPYGDTRIQVTPTTPG